MRDFASLFGDAPTVRADAPGRVNLIGEHTDYNGGFVLPVAIPQRTVAELRPRDGGTVRAWTEAHPGEPPETYVLGAEAPGRGWLDYVMGVTRAVTGAGYAIGGFDLRLCSRVPVGAGLSSSAALEVALLRALREAFALPIDDVMIARLGQRAETDFVGAPVGIMDQMAASLASERAALFLDTRAMTWRALPLPAGAQLAVVDSGLVHAHASGEYRTRRDECNRAAALLGVEQLRDLGTEDLARVGALPPPLDRRARHVVTENARVLAAVKALEEGRLEQLGHLLFASHASMRDDFEVSLPPIDALVEAARAEPAVYGARLTGGGFGGCIVLLCRAGEALGAATRVAERWARTDGGRPTVHVPPGAPS